jgi:hypothetical protein
MSFVDPMTAPTTILGEQLLISSLATFPQNAIKIPAELIKQRAQLSGRSSYEELQRMLASKGLSSLYVGGGAQLLREVPYNAFQMSAFYFLEEWSDGIAKVKELSDGNQAAIVGLFAAAIAALLTQPADVIKTKLMAVDRTETSDRPAASTGYDGNHTDSVGRGSSMRTEGKGRFRARHDQGTTGADSDSGTTIRGPSSPYPGSEIVNELQSILRTEGVGGLYSGTVPRLLLVSIGGTVYFWAQTVTEELVKSLHI